MYNYTDDMDDEYKAYEKQIKDDLNRSESWFDENFTPIKNHLDDNASMDGAMFETFGKELSFIMSIVNGQNESYDQTSVWTYLDDDNGNPAIVNGFHTVNRIGYLVTEESWHSDNDVCEREIFIKL